MTATRARLCRKCVAGKIGKGRFDKVQLKRGAYYPRAHGEDEIVQRGIRDSLAAILSGAKPFPITVTSIAQQQGAPERQQELQRMLSDCLSGKQPLQVVIKQT